MMRWSRPLTNCCLSRIFRKRLVLVFPSCTICLWLWWSSSSLPLEWQVTFWGDAYDFEGFDNETGTKGRLMLIPPIVHYVRIEQPSLSFVEGLCLLSCLFRNPWVHEVWVHTDAPMRGERWDSLKRIFNSRLVEKPFHPPTHVFGSPLTSRYHQSDVARIQLLLEYGGIYLDNDVFVINSLEPFRYFEMVLGWPEVSDTPQDSFIGNQVLIGHKNARFLKLYLQSYRFYRGTLWYHNAGEVPTSQILQKRPELVHRVRKKFGITEGLLPKLYSPSHQKWEEWKAYFTIHLLDRHRYLLDPSRRQQEWTGATLVAFNGTFGEMGRLLLRDISRDTRGNVLLLHQQSIYT